MAINKLDLLKLKQRELEFLGLVETCDRDDLAKCAKFLAMYVALYRQKFGDIPATGYMKLLSNPALDNELLQIMEDGMYEAAEMLKIILLQNRDTGVSTNNNTFLN